MTISKNRTPKLTPNSKGYFPPLIYYLSSQNLSCALTTSHFALLLLRSFGKYLCWSIIVKKTEPSLPSRLSLSAMFTFLNRPIRSDVYVLWTDQSAMGTGRDDTRDAQTNSLLLLFVFFVVILHNLMIDVIINSGRLSNKRYGNNGRWVTGFEPTQIAIRLCMQCFKRPRSCD